jgi:DnaK suppressor protein
VGGGAGSRAGREPALQPMSVGDTGAPMTSKALDPAFIERQRQHLTSLRAALQASAQGGQEEEAHIKNEAGQGPREYEDEAQRLALLELEGDRVRRDLDRLTRVNRALRKIEEGTYGRSDVSGQPIPRERLEAVPEALCTFAEEKAQEQQRRPI